MFDETQPLGAENAEKGKSSKGYNVDSEEFGQFYVDGANESIRQGFVKKVFSIVAAQLAVTFGCVLFFSLNESANNFLKDSERSSGLFLFATILLFVTTIAIMCCNHLTRKHPHNMLLLGGYTFSQSILLSAIGATFDVSTISLAVGVTFSVSVVLVFFASSTTIDFTKFGVYLYIGLWILLIFGFVMMFTSTPFMEMVYTLLGTVLFCFYLIFDVQLILGGNHKVRFGVDDYVMAALMIYIDIIQIFLFILRLLGDSNNS